MSSGQTALLKKLIYQPKNKDMEQKAMKQNRQFVRVNSDFINKNLSAGAVKVLFLLASIAQAGGSDTAVISNARIAERTKLTNKIGRAHV